MYSEFARSIEVFLCTNIIRTIIKYKNLNIILNGTKNACIC